MPPLDVLGPANAPNSTTIRPPDDRLFGASDSWFKDCSTALAKDGTKIKASWLNSVAGFARSIIRGNGNTAGGVAIVTEDNSDDAMALKSIMHMIQRDQPTWAGVAGGTANALTGTLTPAPAELKAGMRVRVKASANNTGPATFNYGAGPAPIVHKDGTALQADEINAGQIIELVYDGTSWQYSVSFGRLLKVRVFTATATYTPTPGTAFIRAKVQGGGGAGGGAALPSGSNVSLGSPGTAGTYGEAIFTAAQIGASKPVTVGQGGTAVAGANGFAGGASSIGSLITCPGGVPGGAFNNQAPPTLNGTGVNSGNASGANLFDSPGGAQSVTVAITQFSGYAGQGGASMFGIGGYGTGINSNGPPGLGYGAGGAGCVINTTPGGHVPGGNGAGGIIIIEEYSL